MRIRLYDSRTREKIELQPLVAGRVSMYVCGPTVYDKFHIGNARTFVVFDVIRRYLEYRGYDVTFVQNFTDVDDKIIRRAREEHRDTMEVAEEYIDSYFEDSDALGVQRATLHPRATAHIAQMIALVECLIEAGHAYVVDGDVYYDISTYEDYGRLSGQDLEQLEEGHRVQVDQRLKHPLDFALWKAAKPEEPSWKSPWGPGRPGWHLECSVMAEVHLGDEFDIHGGGRDLVFPHHENEIAQSVGAGHRFARTWMHVGHLNIQGRKMSKSLGNYRFVRDMFADFSPEVIRYFLLSAHYRKPIDFHGTALEDAKAALMRVAIFREKAERMNESLPEAPHGQGDLGLRAEQAIAEFETAMDDDFNVPQAYAAVHSLVRDVNRILDDAGAGTVTRAGLQAVLDAIATVAGVLGVFVEPAPIPQPPDTELIDAILRVIVARRTEARAGKQFAVADALRDKLAELGVALEDSPEGTHWRLQEGSDDMVDRLVHVLIDVRNEARAAKNWALADTIRDELAAVHVTLEDTADGTHWRLGD